MKTNSKYEILTPNGFQHFDGIIKRKAEKVIQLFFDDQTDLICTPDHVFIEFGSIVAWSLKIGDCIFNKSIVDIIELTDYVVYDPINVAGGNKYLNNYNFISHNCSFTGSTFTLIRPDIIAELSYKHPIHSKDNLDIYTLPQKDNIYVVVSDVSSGVGGDYSALVVIDITNVPYVVVAKYRNNTISTLLYPTVIYSIATEYNNAFVLLENNYSEQVGYILTNEYGYENILYVTKNAKGQTVTGGFGNVGQTYVGVNTDKRIKRIGCFNFKSLLEEKKLLIFDADIISEISTFIESKGSYSADEGYNDDLVITLVLFGWLTTNAYFKELTDVNLRKLMYEQRIQDIEDEMLPVGYLNKGYSKEITIESNDCWFNFNIDEPAFEIPKGYLTDRL